MKAELKNQLKEYSKLLQECLDAIIFMEGKIIDGITCSINMDDWVNFNHNRKTCELCAYGAFYAKRIYDSKKILPNDVEFYLPDYHGVYVGKSLNNFRMGLVLDSMWNFYINHNDPSLNNLIQELFKANKDYWSYEDSSEKYLAWHQRIIDIINKEIARKNYLKII